MTRVWSQRDATGDLAAHGCGLFAAISLITRVTDGAETPTSQRAANVEAGNLLADSGVSLADFRKRGLTPSEVRRMLGRQRLDCRPAIPVRRRSGVAIATDLVGSLTAGAGALVAVRYSVVQDARLGVTSYRGGHWVACWDPRSDGTITVADPLRRSTTRWPVKVLRDAAAAFGSKPWGNGRGEAVVVDAWPTYQQLMRKARGQRDGFKARVAELEAQVDGTELERLRSVAKTVAGRLEEQAELLDAAVA